MLIRFATTREPDAPLSWQSFLSTRGGGRMDKSRVCFGSLSSVGSHSRLGSISPAGLKIETTTLVEPTAYRVYLRFFGKPKFQNPKEHPSAIQRKRAEWAALGFARLKMVTYLRTTQLSHLLIG